jgi:hypothetical protein
MKYDGGKAEKKAQKNTVQEVAYQEQPSNQPIPDWMESCDDFICGPTSIIKYLLCCCGCCTNYDDWSVEQD